MKIAITSGYFDPLHIGHIELLARSKMNADKLIVIVNNDAQARIKKEKEFMNELDRCIIVQSLKFVDEVKLSIDEDTSVCNTLRYLFSELKAKHPDATLVFTKGGDRTKGEIPEAKVCKEFNVYIQDGLGNKIRNSSDFTK